jgi:hypothetical protein
MVNPLQLKTTLEAVIFTQALPGSGEALFGAPLKFRGWMYAPGELITGQLGLMMWRVRFCGANALFPLESVARQFQV